LLQLLNPAMALPQPTLVDPASSPAGAPGLPEWVGLKWLMGLQGHRVDVGRLQGDPDYAATCLAQACGALDPALRGYAERLRQRLR
jgi:hypothetical protein